MYQRLLEYLRCPVCRGVLRLETFSSRDDEITHGVLHCHHAHFFPIVDGVPRFLPDSLEEHWASLRPLVPSPLPESIAPLVSSTADGPAESESPTFTHDQRTHANFSREWDQHELGDRTWSMDLDDRVEAFFLHPTKIERDELAGMLVLDAGCGNGSQSVAYTEHGCEVIAVDLSSGLLHGHAFRDRYQRGNPEKVHFVQADLRHPPLAAGIFDLIHSAGVLHHTPDTRHTFEQLTPLLKPGATMYVWLYKHERYVTPVVNAIRRFTTPLPAPVFNRIATMMAGCFQAFCITVNALGIRSYSKLSRREAALALMDIFGAPYAHYHSYEEVSQWYRARGAVEVWSCNVGRRGFGVCGRFAHEAPEPDATEASAPEPLSVM